LKRTQFLLAVLLAGLAVAVRGGQGPPIVREASSLERRTAPQVHTELTVLARDPEIFVGRVRFPAMLRIQYHRHPRSRLILQVLSGSLLAVVDGKRQRLSVGDVADIPAGVAHSFWNDQSEPTEVFEVFVPPDAAADYDSWPRTGGSGR
jgi:quercetin dioxygenase-like cupin family protein